MFKDTAFDPLPLRRPANWDDVFAITAGRRDVPIELIERGRVDWEYHFSAKEQRACGRRSCEQLHAWGWIVALPGGGFTNVGHDCADKYANKALWGDTTRAYAQRLDNAARDQAVLEGRGLAQQVLYLIDTSPRLAAAIRLHESFLDQLRGPLLEELERRAEKGDSTLIVDIRLSTDELDQRRMSLEAHRPKGAPPVYVPPVEQRTIGELMGLRLFRSGMHPRELKARLNRLAMAVLTNYPNDQDVKRRRALDQDREALADQLRRLNLALAAIDLFYKPRTLDLLMQLPRARALGILSIEVVNGAVRVQRRITFSPRRAA